VNLHNPEPSNEGDSQMEHSSDDNVQELFGSILLHTSSLAVGILHAFLPMKMEQTEFSKTLAHKIQMSENYP
jgi:hypothetical protein